MNWQQGKNLLFPWHKLYWEKSSFREAELQRCIFVRFSWRRKKKSFLFFLKNLLKSLVGWIGGWRWEFLSFFCCSQQGTVTIFCTCDTSPWLVLHLYVKNAVLLLFPFFCYNCTLLWVFCYFLLDILNLFHNHKENQVCSQNRAGMSSRKKNLIRRTTMHKTFPTFAPSQNTIALSHKTRVG